MRGFVKITTVCVLALLLGLHWALLQTVAWTGMMLRYSQESSFKQAIAKTFDGKHPCPLCKAIQKGRAREQQREPQSIPTLKLDFAEVWQTTEFEFASQHELIPAPDRRALPRHESPPKPRPRLASAALWV